MKAISLMRGIDHKCLQGDMQTRITAVVNDSRKIEKGCLFICIKGTSFDGHEFIPQAIVGGAAAILVNDDFDLGSLEGAGDDILIIKVADTRHAMALISAAWFGHPDKELTTIAVTGTKGKTTTAYMIRSILEAAGKKTGIIGTIEVIVGDKHIPVDNTTPESYDIHRYMRMMVDEGCEALVMEASSQGFKLDRTAGIRFDYGLFTNLTPDHIGPNEHESFEEYMSCKAKLFSQCDKGFANLDDEHYSDITGAALCPISSFGVDKRADLWADNIMLTRSKDFLGASFDVEGKCATGSVKGKIDCSVPGTFNVHNALAAMSVALDMGVDFDTIARVLHTFKVKGRVQIVPTGYDYTLIVDYAHNAVALESILKTLRAYDPTRLVALFGCGGNRSRARRYEMGEVSGRLADLTVITSDNPRFEEPQAIIDDIITGIRKTTGKYVSIIDRKDAIAYAMKNALPGDIVVLAGKGHETYQEIKGVKYHMSEEELIAEVLDEIREKA